MSTAATSFTSKRLPYNLTTMNYITAIVMLLFHVFAVAALFYFSWTNFLVALALHWIAVGFGISLGYHRLHTHRGYKTSKAFEYFLAVCGTLTLEGGPDLLGGDASRAPQALGSRGRSAHAARRRILGARRMDPVWRFKPQQHRRDVEVRAGSFRRSVLPVAEHVPLHDRRRRRPRAACGRRMVDGRVGASSCGSSSACTQPGW